MRPAVCTLCPGGVRMSIMNPTDFVKSYVPCFCLPCIEDLREDIRRHGVAKIDYFFGKFTPDGLVSNFPELLKQMTKTLESYLNKLPKPHTWYFWEYRTKKGNIEVSLVIEWRKIP